ncbi:uncharacterized protein SPSK_05714 [Sporothrix schenckii 1099-18]|uniref:Uncharacterized protein n=1 Tax=Sporothrix schenckii 1099-18 TaxID=1397361 RepID=A0A0F2LVM7_SPOSC|nr:uncharacterized protein SPSK_05714 [Sporothrix schenckii 1099-18]KJR80914.1 hypothetical protein SPSK_05714 [Sporothrix schenckii 1099-18]
MYRGRVSARSRPRPSCSLRRTPQTPGVDASATEAPSNASSVSTNLEDLKTTISRSGGDDAIVASTRIVIENKAAVRGGRAARAMLVLVVVARSDGPCRLRLEMDAC